MTGNKFYCNQKFWWLSIYLERQQQFSCCSAAPSPIDFEWLSNNPGKLFNTPLLHQERQNMLNGISVDSCRDSCFAPEEKGLQSRRIVENGTQITHTNINSSPETLNIVLGSTCNLTCVYCCKQYSSAWLKDIEQNGSYLEHNRFKIFKIDQIKKHSQIESDPNYHTLISELTNFKNIDVHISGGEPFLYNNLESLVKSLDTRLLRINTGLGVDPRRFRQQLERIKDVKNLEIVVSAESSDGLYEFVRYGNSYQRFNENLKTIQELGVRIQILSVVSNVTLLGLPDFYRKHTGEKWYFSLCNDPDFLSVNVLDQDTKNLAIKKWESSDIPIKEEIIANIQNPYTDRQKNDFSKYIIEFSRRRNLDLNVFPPGMVKWIHNDVDLQN